MPSHFNVEVRVEQRVTKGSAQRRGLALFGGALLVVGVIVMLWANIGFARYAFTGFLWSRADGTVVTTHRTSSPTIQFFTPDGRSHSFTEDYVLLCGGSRTFCFIRNFDQGQIVPLVYDSGAPGQAFIYDWALFASTITWFIEAALALGLMLMLGLVFVNKPILMRIRGGGGPPD